MKTFTDKNGRRHGLELTVGSARRVMAETGINLVEPLETIDGKTAFEQLASNIELVVDVAFALSGESDPMAFASCIDGDTIDRMVTALMEEVINFSRPPLRTLMAKAWQAIQEQRETAVRQAESVTAEQIKAEIWNCATASQG